MKSNSETGHAMNVANFKEAISIVTGYGTAYNPSNDAIKLPGLQTSLANAEGAVGRVNAILSPYSIAVGNRDATFGPLSSLTTRVLNALKATGVIEQLIKTAKTIIRKIQGRRAVSKLSEEEKAALAAEGQEVKEISSSQMSFDSRVDNFNKLIELLAGIPLYTPNEPELSVESLRALYDDMKEKNAAVILATTALTNARIARNEALYDETTGLCQLAASMKAYVKSLFGATSPQYKQISKLSFKTIKR
jgi:hypothetical protein